MRWTVGIKLAESSSQPKLAKIVRGRLYHPDAHWATGYAFEQLPLESTKHRFQGLALEQKHLVNA